MATPKFIVDLPDCDVGDPVTLTGHVTNVQKYSSRLHVRLRDLTDTTTVELPRSAGGSVIKGDRIRVTGHVGVRPDGSRIIVSPDEAETLGRFGGNLGDVEAD